MLNLPITILEQDNKFDSNYPTIVMLSGQGSSGKTTFQQKYLHDKIIIAVDDIVRELHGKHNWQLCLDTFFNRIKQYTSNNEINNDIILDYSHDTIESRADSLKYIQNTFNFNFIIIHLSLDFDLLLENDKRKRQVSFLSEEYIKTIKGFYDFYQAPHIQEFEKYGFKSITIAEYKQIAST